MIQRFIEVTKEANGYLHKYELYEKGWRFEFSSTQNFMGDCSHHDKLIRFSKHYITSDPRQITDTLLHEIAHALVDAKHGHDATWKAMAASIGADPFSYPDSFTASTQVKNTAKPNYRIKCPKCGWSITRFRLRRKSMRGAMCPVYHTEVEFYKLRHS